MMDKLKNHISNNRGKYGTAMGVAGTGALVAPYIDQAGVNGFGYKIMSNANNLVSDTKIPESKMEITNAYYNTPLTKVYNPNPIDVIKTQREQTIAQQNQEAQQQAEQTQLNLGQKASDAREYLDEKWAALNQKLNPQITENIITFNIKEAILEGHQLEEIVEAVHANHPELNKKNSFNNRPRKKLANELNQLRKGRDSYRKSGDQNLSNAHDNYARFRSSTGASGKYSRDPLHKIIPGVSLRTNINRVDNDPTIVKMEKNNELHGGLKKYLPPYNQDNSKNIDNKLQSDPRIFTSAKK